jgi:hypothetical protein
VRISRSLDASACFVFETIGGISNKFDIGDLH